MEKEEKPEALNLNRCCYHQDSKSYPSQQFLWAQKKTFCTGLENLVMGEKEEEVVLNNADANNFAGMPSLIEGTQNIVNQNEILSSTRRNSPDNRISSLGLNVPNDNQDRQSRQQESHLQVPSIFENAVSEKSIVAKFEAKQEVVKNSWVNMAYEAEHSFSEFEEELKIYIRDDCYLS
ncbi:hypothetical protein VNO80_04943 [Phaseolus coccineus]|uniref:Uncharacterized protein n=1 Tax=Phaseolus coccineus TaxID=3886 RepID=A0AAN9NV43_PHACN